MGGRATSILLFGGGRTTPQGHGSGSATPKPAMGVARVTPLFLFFQKKKIKLLNFLLLFLVFNFYLSIGHVSTLRGIDMDFRQFLDESWTNVSSPSLAINKVPSTIRIEPLRIKNKIFKP
jgi:hypothetical protein